MTFPHVTTASEQEEHHDQGGELEAKPGRLFQIIPPNLLRVPFKIRERLQIRITLQDFTSQPFSYRVSIRTKHPIVKNTLAKS